METQRLDELLARLHEAEAELAEEIDRLTADERSRFSYSVQRGRVSFEAGVRELQQRYRTGIWPYLRDAPLRHIITAPVIYAMVVPLALLDLGISLYQHICFRAYGIPRVRRGDYVVIDRHHLAYLNIIERFNCVYCGYGNGVVAYAREIVSRTEQFWCPIKHARRVLGEHERTARFFEYGNAQGYRTGLDKLRREWDVHAEERT